MVASAGGVLATGRSGIGATKIKSAVEGGALAALENADESAGSPGDAPAASYTVRQGDTLSLIAKKYYGNGRKYLALVEADRTTLAHPDKIYPGMVVCIPPLS